MRTRWLKPVFLSVALLISLGGCAGTVKQIKGKSKIMRSGVFSEVKGEEPPPKGTVDLAIKASIKKPVEGYYLLEQETPPEGKVGYPFELNIDGQEIVWKVDGKEEITPRYDENGRIIPEGGEGIRYALIKKIRLKTGLHHVLFGLPYEDYYTEVKVSLREGRLHTLEFQPIYAMRLRGGRTFFHGIKRYSVFLDGTHIK
jgi:hypothetical protein